MTNKRITELTEDHAPSFANYLVEVDALEINKKVSLSNVKDLLVPVEYAMWDPYVTFLSLFIGEPILLSNDLLTATSTVALTYFPLTSILTLPKDTGKIYFEYTIGYDSSGSGDSAFIGVTSQLSGVGYDVYSGDKGTYTFPTTIVTEAYGSGVVSGDILMCAFDLDNLEIWWGENGTWCDSGDPVTRVNPAYDSGTLTVSSFYNFMVMPNAGIIVTANYGASPFIYPVPAGYKSGWYKE